MTTKEVIEKYFEFVNSGNWDAYLTLFDQNVIMEEQLLGHIEGIENVAAGIEGLRNNREFRNFPLEIIVEGDKAVALWNIQSPMANGNKLDLKGANYYRVKDGKIVYFSNFHDTSVFK
ncbi:MAG: nuclear transport factor 2 family protein [Bacteroidota bacterium]|nr:nuclear transport factor 2 family protein [Bacteroidota bacterium]